MTTGWQRRFAAAHRAANRLTPEERQQEKERQKCATQPLSRRFYCPHTYLHASVERVCGYWPPEHVWWKQDEPYCDVHRTPLEIHPGLNTTELQKEQRQLRKMRKRHGDSTSK